MKKLTLILLCFLPFLSFSQDNEGEIIYEQIIKIEFDRSRMPDHMKDMEKMIPKEQRYKKQLVFNEQATYFQHFNDPNAEAVEVATEGPGSRMRMMMMRPEEKTYVDLSKMALVQQKDFFGRMFLIKDSVETHDWKITGDQKTILDYPVMKAVTTVDSMEVVAWFAPTIPVAGGPEGMAGLPGMVLEVSLQNGKIQMVAEKIDMRKVAKNELEEPKKGKEVTREEYNEIVKEKMKEMREANGGHGGHGPGGGRVIMMHGE